LKAKTELKTWYFAFFKNPRQRLPAWIKFCMRENYSHVLAFSQIHNFVQVLDPVHSHLDVSLRIHPSGCHLPMPVDFIALDFALHGAEVVKITYPVDRTPTTITFTNLFPGCVTIAKGLLGISEWVFTPWQFHQWLLENGGELLTKEKQDLLLDQLVGCHLTSDERQNIFKYLKGD
jgi:hypothetical protein